MGRDVSTFGRLSYCENQGLFHAEVVSRCLLLLAAMKTIESCEMSSSPSPPRLEDPDLIKMSKTDNEKTVKEKNGFKEDKITKEDKVNGCSSDTEEEVKKTDSKIKEKSEAKSDSLEENQIKNGDDKTEVKENGSDTEVKENGSKSETEKDSAESCEENDNQMIVDLMKYKIQNSDEKSGATEKSETEKSESEKDEKSATEKDDES